MGLHVFWPPVAAVAVFVLMVAVLVLKYGERWCRARVSAPAPLAHGQQLRQGTEEEMAQWRTKAYQQDVSYA